MWAEGMVLLHIWQVAMKFIFRHVDDYVLPMDIGWISCNHLLTHTP